MGMEASVLTPTAMPSYYVEDPVVTPEVAEVLQFSLGSITEENGFKVTNVRFNEFQNKFFKKLKEAEEKMDGISVDMYFGNQLRARRLFFSRLVSIVERAPTHFMDAHLNGKWKHKARVHLKKFFKDFKDLRLEAYAYIGEALLYSVGECDQMFTRHVNEAWSIAYSLFLDQFIPIGLRYKQKIERKSIELDLSDTDSLDFSNPSDDDRPRAKKKRPSDLRKQIMRSKISKMKSFKKYSSDSLHIEVSPVRQCRATLRPNESLTQDDQAFLTRLSNPGKGKNRKWSAASSQSDSGSGYESAGSVDSNVSRTSQQSQTSISLTDFDHPSKHTYEIVSHTPENAQNLRSPSSLSKSEVRKTSVGSYGSHGSHGSLGSHGSQ